MGVHKMTTRTETASFGILGSLSPEMARDLGDAFSLQRIGAESSRGKRSDANAALRLASRALAFLAVTVVAVSLTVAALYLMQP